MLVRTFWRRVSLNGKDFSHARASAGGTKVFPAILTHGSVAAGMAKPSRGNISVVTRMRGKDAIAARVKRQREQGGFLISEGFKAQFHELPHF